MLRNECTALRGEVTKCLEAARTQADSTISIVGESRQRDTEWLQLTFAQVSPCGCSVSWWYYTRSSKWLWSAAGRRSVLLAAARSGGFEWRSGRRAGGKGSGEASVTDPTN